MTGVSNFPGKQSNTEIVARNSFWYGVETGVNVVCATITAVAVARVIGPLRLGYYSYVSWLVNISGLLGSVGLPLTTRRFMAECLGRGEGGAARAVFRKTLRQQTTIATGLAVAGVAAALHYAEANYRLVSALLALSLLPRMIALIPSQANMAAEDSAANLPGALLNNVLVLLMTGLSLILGWDLLGIAIGTVIGYTAEMTVKLMGVSRWISAWPRQTMPPDFPRRMWRFSGHGTILMILQLLVWGRSDVFLLRWLNSDIRQVTFFSVAFTLAERLLQGPQMLAHGLSVNVFAQFWREKEKLKTMIPLGLKYMLLLGLPFLLGASALSQPLVTVVLGPQYLPAIPVVALACGLAIGKTVAQPAINLMRAGEVQGFLLGWTIFSGVVNITLDVLLVPSMGAVGAAIGNGLGQTVGAVGIWYYAIRRFGLHIEWRPMAWLGLSTALMYATARMASWLLPLWPGLVAGTVAGAVVFLTMLRVGCVLDSTDRKRLAHLERRFPPPARFWVTALLHYVAPAGSSCGPTARS